MAIPPFGHVWKSLVGPFALEGLEPDLVTARALSACCLLVQACSTMVMPIRLLAAALLRR